METHLNRYLRKEEIVHHINGIPADDRVENLLIMSRGEHTRIHTYDLPKDPLTGRFMRMRG